MGFLHCCSGLKRSVTYTLAPSDGYLIAELDILDTCPVCDNFVVQLTRIDFEHKVSVVRKSNIAARRFLERLEASILFKQEYKYSPLKSRGGSFYLGYSEYGVKKRCYSNLSNLSIGRDDFEKGLYVTNPIFAGLPRRSKIPQGSLL